MRRARFQPVVEMRGRIQPRAIQEPTQDFTPLVPEQPAGNEGVLAPDLIFVLGESIRRRAENRQIHIDQQPRVRILRHRVVLSYEAEAAGVTNDDVVTRIVEGVEVP